MAKDKYEEFRKDWPKKMKGLLKGEYTFEGENIQVSSEVEDVINQALADKVATLEEIETKALYVAIPKAAKGDKALADFYRQLTKELEGLDLYAKASDSHVVAELQQKLEQLRGGKEALAGAKYNGDAQSYATIKQMISQDIATKLANKRVTDAVDKLRNKNGTIPVKKLIELGAGMASYEQMQSLKMATPSPYKNLSNPERNLDGLVGGLLASGCAYSRAGPGEKAIAQYGN